MLYIVDGDCHGLFEQTVLFELVGIHQGANQTSVAILIGVFLQLNARGLGREGISGIIVGFAGRLGRGIWLAGLEVSLAPFGRSLLLAGGKGAVELSVYEEIRQDPTRAPWYPICPSLDPGSGFLVHKDVSTYDQLAPFTVMRSSEAVGQGTGEACLEDDQCVLSGLDMPSPCWHTCRGFPNVHSNLCEKTAEVIGTFC